ncbi:hypothetical protein Y032_0520g2852 [Ancylostoma ceylanicum]|uniref:Uncharacterized protein n=1 Tax=Ancylostoma ceylanicum TaxID=53326 RepID=A0A016WSV4_9BILA|nr:hypothetical protein Y032_0520g2852 [Ancylostoma ceylanicum]
MAAKILQKMISPEGYALPEPVVGEQDGCGKTNLPARTAPAHDRIPRISSDQSLHWATVSTGPQLARQVPQGSSALRRSESKTKFPTPSAALYTPQLPRGNGEKTGCRITCTSPASCALPAGFPAPSAPSASIPTPARLTCWKPASAESGRVRRRSKRLNV